MTLSVISSHTGKLFAAGCILLLAVFSLSAFHVPPLTGRVVDEVELFSSSEKDALEKTVQSFEQATGGQLFIAVLKPFDDVSIEEAGLKLMDEWKPGEKGKDNGAILLIVPEARKMRLEIGYGWEGAVNDAKAGDVIRLMAPYFRKNQYAEGVTAAVEALGGILTGGADLPPAEEESSSQEDDDSFSSVIAVVLVIVLVILCIRYPWLLFFLLSSGGGGGRGGGGGGGGGGFSGGGGGRGGGGGASGSW